MSDRMKFKDYHEADLWARMVARGEDFKTADHAVLEYRKRCKKMNDEPAGIPGLS